MPQVLPRAGVLDLTPPDCHPASAGTLSGKDSLLCQEM